MALAAVMALLAAAPAEAARTADAKTRRALAAAAAKWSATDSLALTRAGRLIEQAEGYRQRLEYQGMWVSSLSRAWARVIVITQRDDKISTILRRRAGRWRAVASGGLDGNRRDGAQCARSGIPRLVAIDLGLGRDGAHDPARRCEGPESARRRAMTAAELDAATPTATSEDWPGVRDDYGLCVEETPDHPRAGYVSRSLPEWSFVQVYCTGHFVDGQPATGIFAAVLRNGQPVERLNVSEKFLGLRCWSGDALPGMPIRARVELGVCTPTPSVLLVVG